MPRHRKEIAWPEFDKLCSIQCTLREIAAYFDCSEDTIERACKRDKKLGFAEYYGQKAGIGKISLRRKQFEVAMSGDKTMLIWLGKQLLGQAEPQDQQQQKSGTKELYGEEFYRDLLAKDVSSK